MKRTIILFIVFVVFSSTSCKSSISRSDTEPINQTGLLTKYFEIQDDFHMLEENYDTYLGYYEKVFSSTFSLDEATYIKYSMKDDVTFRNILYNDFSGKDKEEAKAFLFEILDIKSIDEILSVLDVPNVHTLEISQVYSDPSIDWEYVFVRENIETDSFEALYTYRYTFEFNEDTERSEVIMKDMDLKGVFPRTSKDVETSNTNDEFEKDIAYQSFLGEAIVYVDEINLEYPISIALLP